MKKKHKLNPVSGIDLINYVKLILNQDNINRNINNPYFKNEFYRHLSHFVISKNFNAEWLIKYFYSGLDIQSFNLVNSSFPHLLQEPFKYISTVQKLRIFAECLFNFQIVENFEHQIKTIHDRTDSYSSSGFQGAMAELQAARYLYLADIPFSFIKESGKEGFDYEFQSELPNGSSLACEVKCKIEETKFGFKTFIDSYNKAIKQTQYSPERLIFIKVPQEWSKSEEFYELALHPFRDTTVNNMDFVLFYEVKEKINGVEKWMLRMLPLILFRNGDIRNKIFNHFLYEKNIEKNPRYTSFDEIFNKFFLIKYGIILMQDEN